MSDRGGRDREARDAGELRERLVAVETKLNELPRVRDRVHDLVQCTQQLVSASEAADDARASLAEKVDALGGKMEAAMLASARAEVSLGATLSAHIEQCKTDKAEIRNMLTAALSDQKTMHESNTTKLDLQQTRLTRLEVRMAFYAGAAVVVTWLLSHGIELIEKLFK